MGPEQTVGPRSSLPGLVVLNNSESPSCAVFCQLSSVFVLAATYIPMVIYFGCQGGHFAFADPHRFSHQIAKCLQFHVGLPRVFML